MESSYNNSIDNNLADLLNDKFLHKIQQYKMKELWNNKEDEFWENV
jgi:hypothetical protein